SLRGIPTLKTAIFVPPVANHVPHLLIRYDQSRVKISPIEVAAKMRQGNPSIELNPATGTSSASAGLPTDGNTIVVGVWMLQPGEDSIVADHLLQVLEEAAGA
ncbi:MAG: selenocysteine synthase, partial [Acidobacteriota bacterium]|nr:selenocysteine synthase [Acidobacteriota bacterium]